MTGERSGDGAGVAGGQLRVLVVHNRYQQAGGEDVVFEAETELLRRAGHAVETMVMDNDSISGHMSVGERARLAARTAWSTRSARMIRQAVRSWRPHVMHAHNTFPLWSPSIFAAARREGVATVLTLHNYRLICPSADLFRDGHPCEDCVGRTVAWPGVRHACYRDSRLQTGTVAAMLAFNRGRRTWQRDIDAYIALTDFARTRLLRGGLPSDRIHVKPNFLYPDPGPSSEARSGFLFAGRLTDEKGVRTLIEAARSITSGEELRVAGTGPLDDELRVAAATIPSLRVLGQLDRAELLLEMGRSTALVVPSLWYEGFPMTVVEAFATGTPVIASRLGSLAEVITDGTGLLFEASSGRALSDALAWAGDHIPDMAERGREARRVFETKYGAAANLAQLLSIYDTARDRLARPARAHR